MALPASDNFNRADANPIGGNWTTSGNLAAMRLLSNQVKGSTTGTCGAYWNADAFNDDQYSQIKGVSATYQNTWGPSVRVAAGGTEICYFFRYQTSTTLRVYKINGGSASQIGSDYSNTYVQNDILRLEVSGQDASAVLTPYINGVAQATRAGSAGFNSGSAGIRQAAATQLMDDWGGGNLGGAIAGFLETLLERTFPRHVLRGVMRGVA
jgi:hypothetical protein